MSDGPFFKFRRRKDDEDFIWARPIKKTKVIKTDRGNVIGKEGEDWDMLDPKSGIAYVNDKPSFRRRYEPVDDDAQAAFEEYYDDD